MHTANSCKKHYVSVSPGAQFGDEEEEEDEAGPMEGVTEALPDAGGQLPLSACLQMGLQHTGCFGLCFVSTNALWQIHHV